MRIKQSIVNQNIRCHIDGIKSFSSLETCHCGGNKWLVGNNPMCIKCNTKTPTMAYLSKLAFNAGKVKFIAFRACPSGHFERYVSEKPRCVQCSRFISKQVSNRNKRVSNGQ